MLTTIILIRAVWITHYEHIKNTARFMLAIWLNGPFMRVICTFQSCTWNPRA